jgi:hypothetical protein
MTYNPKKKYVGPQGSWLNKLIPRKVFGVDWNYPSYLHDHGYAKGWNKLEEDNLWLSRCMHNCETYYDWPYLPNTIMRNLVRLIFFVGWIAIRDRGKHHFTSKKP